MYKTILKIPGDIKYSFSFSGKHLTMASHPFPSGPFILNQPCISRTVVPSFDYVQLSKILVINFETKRIQRLVVGSVNLRYDKQVRDQWLNLCRSPPATYLRDKLSERLTIVYIVLNTF